MGITESMNGVTFAVKRATVRDNLRRSQMLAKVRPLPDGMEYAWWEFLTLVTRTDSIEGLKFTLPDTSDDADNLRLKFEAYLDSDARVAEAWADLVNRMNASPGDPDYAPPETLTADEKKR